MKRADAYEPSPYGRLIGTREGFDIYLGGGVAGDVHLGLKYKLGVDVDQLPLVIDEVVKTYYLKHKAGQTFSDYWRQRLDEELGQPEAGAYRSVPAASW